MSAERHRSHAFGLAIEADLPLPGLPDEVGAGLRTAFVRRASATALDRRWPRDDARILSAELAPDGSLRTIATATGGGYRLDAPGYGLAHVSADGVLVDCAPPPAGEGAWHWQRFLVGRVLPFAAALAGLEPLHAGAVVLDGRAVAVLGATGTGKSSVTARLMLAGAAFLTDDVLALEPAAGGGVLAHAGPAVLAVRDAEAAALGSRLEPLGAPLGAGGGKRYLAPVRAGGPVALGAVALLERDDDAMGLAVRRVEPDAKALLAAAFVPEVGTAARLLGQLELVARIAREVPVLAVGVPSSADAGDVAHALLDALGATATAR